MKTYISAGIGDMMCFDSLLTKEERESITELYWACRFGKVIAPLMENNPSYPNLKKQHFIDDEVGANAMRNLNSVAVPFWHFRPDIPSSLETGLSLFGLNANDDDVQIIDVIGTFAEVCDSVRKGSPKFYESTFLKHANKPEYSDYILFHYPTSTRPRQDISTITESDWQFIDDLSKETGKQVIIISDSEIKVPLSNFELLVNPDIKLIVDLSAYCDYFAGCDSFCSVLATKRLPKEKIFVKTHDKNIARNLPVTNHYFYAYYSPHPPEDIAQLYKPYIGNP